MKKTKRNAVVVNIMTAFGLIISMLCGRYDLMAALTFTFGISLFFILENES